MIVKTKFLSKISKSCYFVQIAESVKDIAIKELKALVSDDEGFIMGNGRMAILDSINQTSKEMKMAYKTVWSKIKSTEKNFGKPVVHADKKTGTRLTDEGRKLLEKYRQLKKQCLKAEDTIFDDIFPD